MSFRTMIVAFLVTVAVAELGARALQPHLPSAQLWDSPFAQDKATAAEVRGPVDVAVVGSSIANANLDIPLMLERLPWEATGYNAALPAEAPRQWELWAGDVVFPELCPRVLVVAVGPRDTNDNRPGMDRSLDHYRTSVGRLELYGQAPPAEGFEAAMERLSALVAIRERLREPANLLRYLLTGSAPGWPNTNLTDDGRYRGFEDDPVFEPDPEVEADLATGAMADYEVGPLEFGALERLIRAAEEQGITVVLVDMPYMRGALAGVVDDGIADLERYETAVDDLAARTGVPLLRHPELDDRPELYADYYHMRAEGMRLLSQRVGEDLALLIPSEPAAVACRPRSPEA